MPIKSQARSVHRYLADEEEDDSEDEATAVGTDLSLLPPTPGQSNRAGFAANPVSEQVFYDKGASPSAVPKPASRVKAQVGSRRGAVSQNRPPHPALVNGGAGPQTHQQFPNQHVSFRTEQQFQGAAHSETPTAFYPHGRDSDEETVVDDLDRYDRLPAMYHQSARAPAQHNAYQYAPARTPTLGLYTPHPQAVDVPAHLSNTRQAAHGYSFRDDEPEDEGNDSDEAFTAVGTGVATDLSLEEDLGLQGPTNSLHAASTAFPQARQTPLLANWSLAQARHSVASPAQRYTPPPISRKPSRSAQHMVRAPTSSGLSADYRPPSPLRVDFSSPLFHALPATTSHAPNSLASRRYAESTISDSTASDATATPPARSMPISTHSPAEQAMLELLKEMNFSVALRDLHDFFGLGVQKTIVAGDGRGHAYVKVYCKNLPKADQVEHERHLRNHWVPLAGTTWEFRTSSEHCVTVVWKTIGA